MKKTIKALTLLSGFLYFSGVTSADSLNLDYEWTNKHPMLTSYIEKNKELVKRITPHKIIKAEQYIKYIEKQLKKNNLPKELVILAAIESGFKEHAVSSANAIGMWQFTKETGLDWGLEINSKVDERKDWKKSTVAAVKYIDWMASTYFEGNYESAILSYNAGIGRIQAAMIKYDTRDPWELITYDHLPQESRDFLPKFITYLHYFYYLKEKEENKNK
jgi:soluble lytic murein transglycosylase-like protein